MVAPIGMVLIVVTLMILFVGLFLFIEHLRAGIGLGRLPAVAVAGTEQNQGRKENRSEKSHFHCGDT